jgi:hypothetical protein
MLKGSLPHHFFTNFTQIKSYVMKIFTSILVFLALALIIFNITLLDFDHLFEGNSMVALIGVVSSFCAVFILLIFRMSKAI